MMKKILLILFTFTILINSTYSQCTELFFSQYLEAFGDDKAIEIYNPTTSSINLNDYKLKRHWTGGPPFTSDGVDSIVLSGTINANSTYVIARSGVNSAVSSDMLDAIINHNGNDAYSLTKISSGLVVDIIGPLDVGARKTTAILLTTSDSMKDMTLVRKSTIEQGNTNWGTNKTEWNSFPVSTYTGFGTHICDCDKDTTAGFVPSSLSINEDAGNILVDVQFNKAYSTNQSITLSLLSGNAADLTTTLPQSVNLLAGSKKATFNIGINDNTIQDGNKTLTFRFTGINANTKKTADSIFTLTIVDDEAPSEVGVKSQYIFRKQEGESGFIDIVLNKPTKNATSVDYTISGVNSGAVVNQDLTNFNPANTISFNAGDSIVRLTFDAIKDDNDESVDTFLFELKNPTGLVLSSSMSFTMFRVVDSTESGITGRPYYKIGVLRGANTGNIPDSMNVECSIRGVLYGDNTRSTGYQMAICDETGCIGIYSSKEFTQFKDEKEGDSVEITGRITHFRGYGQINFSSSIDTIKKQGFKTIKPAKTVTKLDESTESHLVKLENLVLKNGSWSDSSNFNLTMANADDASKEYEIRIINFDNRFGTFNLIESGKTYNITGIGGQFDTSATLSGAYQLVPRREADIVEKTGGGNTGSITSVEKFSLQLFPNPITRLTNTLNIQANELIGNSKVTLTNINGEVVFEEFFVISKGRNEIQLNTSTLSAGNYILKVTSDKGQTDMKLSIIE